MTPGQREATILTCTVQVREDRNSLHLTFSSKVQPLLLLPLFLYRLFLFHLFQEEIISAISLPEDGEREKLGEGGEKGREGGEVMNHLSILCPAFIFLQVRFFQSRKKIPQRIFFPFLF